MTSPTDHGDAPSLSTETAAATASRPVVQLWFHPHWVDAAAIDDVLTQLNPSLTVLTGDHRLNQSAVASTSRLGLTRAEQSDAAAEIDLVVLFADQDDDSTPHPQLPQGATLLVCSHAHKRHTLRWRLGP